MKISRISVVAISEHDFSGHVWNYNKDGIVGPATHNLPSTKQDVVDFMDGMSDYNVKEEDIYLL